MITQDTIDLIRGYTVKDGIPEHCKNAAMNILRSEMPYLDMPPQEGEYKSRLFTSEAELLIEAICNKSNLAKEREQMLQERLKSNKKYVDSIYSKLENLTNFMIHAIESGYLKIPE